MFISLGPACSVKYHIDKYLKTTRTSQYTHFFDYLISSEKAILTLLSCKDIDAKLKTIDNGVHSNGKAIITLPELDNTTSIHDIKEQYTKQDIDTFINKYKRRYYRLLNDIHSSTEPIIFIRRSHVSANFESKIAPYLLGKHYLVTISKEVDKDDPLVKYNATNRHLILNFWKFKQPKNNDPEWADPELNWSRIFETIKKVLK